MGEGEGGRWNKRLQDDRWRQGYRKNHKDNKGGGGRMRKTVGLIFYLICCDLCCSWLCEPPRRHIRGRTVY